MKTKSNTIWKFIYKKAFQLGRFYNYKSIYSKRRQLKFVPFSGRLADPCLPEYRVIRVSRLIS